ncbi:hypothetical protein F4782DRAFT_533550 [Xylaria castorea]|nr:hypothetical protein F4782DRAFT_533550 [Xylaria castorea]
MKGATLNVFLVTIAAALLANYRQLGSDNTIEGWDGTTEFNPDFALKTKSDGTTEFDHNFALKSKQN